MPELRRDPVIGRWVIVSTERAKRPDQFAAAPAPSDDDPKKCPFCEGNERMTPPEIFALRSPAARPDTPGWQVRVVPSIKPLLMIEGELDRHGHGMYDLMNARGAHEVIIESPRHTGESSLSPDEIANAVNVALDRIADLERDPRIKYALYFKNYGEAAGGGHIKHSRSQIIGTPVNLKRVKEELAGAKGYYDIKERCVYCDMIKQEIDAARRVIAQSEHFIAIAPFASRFPFETWLLPKRHGSDFYKLDRALVPDLAKVINLIFLKMRKVIGDFPFNLVLHTAPFRRDRSKKRYWETIDYDFHWHFELLPILTRVAGFEWGSGFYINPLPPEDAARAVKSA